LARLPEIIERRRAIRDRYADAFNHLPGIHVMGDPSWGKWNGWLTTVRFDSSFHPRAPTRVREALELVDIESRPVWKPMHQQPVFRDATSVVTGAADRIFIEGLCLPSGTAMANADIDRVIDVTLAEIGNL
jgi:dTDP-4-amino-4,6-dideoxygalactose transaminase